MMPDRDDKNQSGAESSGRQTRKKKRKGGIERERERRGGGDVEIMMRAGEGKVMPEREATSER
jgi:hypothetical protein